MSISATVNGTPLPSQAASSTPILASRPRRLRRLVSGSCCEATVSASARFAGPSCLRQGAPPARGIASICRAACWKSIQSCAARAACCRVVANSASRTAWKRLKAARAAGASPSRSCCADRPEQASARSVFASLNSASAMASSKYRRAAAPSRPACMRPSSSSTSACTRVSSSSWPRARAAVSDARASSSRPRSRSIVPDCPSECASS